MLLCSNSGDSGSGGCCCRCYENYKMEKRRFIAARSSQPKTCFVIDLFPAHSHSRSLAVRVCLFGSAWNLIYMNNELKCNADLCLFVTFPSCTRLTLIPNCNNTATTDACDTIKLHNDDDDDRHNHFAVGKMEQLHFCTTETNGST